MGCRSTGEVEIREGEGGGVGLKGTMGESGRKEAMEIGRWGWGARISSGVGGRVGFHISLGSFSRGVAFGGAMRFSRVEAVAGRVDCQLSLTEKVTKEDGREDILRAGVEMVGRRCQRRRSQRVELGIGLLRQGIFARGTWGLEGDNQAYIYTSG